MLLSTCSGVAKPGPTWALALASAHLALASEIDDDYMINLYHYSLWRNYPNHQPLWPTISISTYHVNSTLYKTIGWLSMAGYSLTGHRLPIQAPTKIFMVNYFHVLTRVNY